MRSYDHEVMGWGVVSQVVLVIKNWPANAGCGFDPWVRNIHWRGHDNPLQYSSLGNLMDKGAWQATVHEVAKNLTQLKHLRTQVHVRSWEWGPNEWDYCLCKSRLESLLLLLCFQPYEDTMQNSQSATWTRRFSPEPNAAGILIPDCQPPEPW